MLLRLARNTALHRSRGLAHRTSGTRAFSSPLTQPPKDRLVILGAGWAGYKLLQKIDTKKRDVIVVAPRNHFNLTPLLPSASVGTLDFRSISEPIRGLRGNEVEFYQASCQGLDLDNKTLHLASALDDNKGEPFSLRYDNLVIAVGAVSNTFNIPGVKDHCFFLKNTSDARRIRQRIVECFEHASQPNCLEAERRSLLHFVVVGGGPTGIEFAAELHDFIEEDLHHLYPGLRSFIQITIVEAGPTILSAFDDSLQRYCLEKYRKEGIQILTKHSVAAVEPKSLVLSDGSHLAYGLVLWGTGVAPTDFVANLDVKKNRAGRIVVDDRLRLPSHPEVFALGDCAAIENNELPCTAQVAQQQGKYLAKELNFEGPPSEFKTRFHYVFRGMLAYVGSWKAIASTTSPVQEGWRGTSAWILWRSFYLFNAVSWKNKILIPMHWFLTWLFGRDTSRF